MKTQGALRADRVIHHVRLIDAGEITDDAWIAFRDGRVAAVGQGDTWRDHSPVDVHDGDGAWLTPGFVDIHAHGGAGHAFDDGADAIAEARAMHRSRGTTRAVLSLVTASIDDLAARVATVARLAREDATILGSHLEGPFLDLGHKGAHTPALLRAPDAAAVDRLLAAGDGTIRQVTLAPELPGADDAIRRFTAAGVAVAVGHTDADADATRRAFDAGATILTHAFNGMRGIHHRDPGPVVAAMQDERVTLELIADGTHVHPDVMRVVFAGAPGRVALITDAMGAAGSADGAYTLGGLAVTVTDGVARLDDGGSIAGSTLTQDAALRIVTGQCGVSMPDAVDALTAVPARAIGAQAGSLAVGATADAVLLDAALGVRAVWVDGVPA
ncbi:N-acetylglucosamine-6-phosphate deacetylase [Microbacterium sp. zg.Y1090]|uniref:N-acetylglucosamine-6-phosphate deacetylase n=1 Tax=Microbacterium TaxID=33882 RepID=UPI00214BAADB|nr:MULTISPECIES: N-acetylglucosamine-6-phosphate deacetylase [unclassified Microbacterium]MCR2813701.1 N-acetylglucosamine-6-phosphate deacetylase [Microbacterium sp. zg.Y1084]MCR2817966.1 N-acetylglucosamine-6-phosphate deacetylase [Microbacterium sp. zg.Y1090]MDL5487820.1 N-acetylglucosamine-6-phosphate deacetylase [Microbacterium sp. zg-Y1211]WIM27870.1 N-acetylglucosamine-6-phosphate deacetylase [Microbacterium sp. zg-Y1090]